MTKTATHLMKTDVVAKADAFAERAHGLADQRRKYTGEPYIEHPRAVAEHLRRLGFRDAVLAAALLHDVVEDTVVTIDEIRAEFGDRIAGWVAALTDVPAGQGLNRHERKRLNLARLADADAEVHSIKLADLINNTSTIVAHDPDWAPPYLREKKAAIAVLTRGHPRLIEEANQAIESGFQHLRLRHSH